MSTNDIWDTQVPEQESEQEVEEEKNLGDLLFQIAGSPDKSQVEKWKQEFGEVFCSGFSETEMFVFRPLSRQEFVQLQTAVQSQERQLSEADLEEQIVKRCVLWGSESGLASLDSKAGSLSTLHEQIMQNSNFVNPAIAARLVVKL
jgi:hypothetical protein